MEIQDTLFTGIEEIAPNIEEYDLPEGEVLPLTKEELQELNNAEIEECNRVGSINEAARAEVWAATEYQRQRQVDYPSIGDQLDALFHAGVFPEEMAAQIQAVKDMYPKEI